MSACTRDLESSFSTKMDEEIISFHHGTYIFPALTKLPTVCMITFLVYISNPLSLCRSMSKRIRPQNAAESAAYKDLILQKILQRHERFCTQPVGKSLIRVITEMQDLEVDSLQTTFKVALYSTWHQQSLEGLGEGKSN